MDREAWWATVHGVTKSRTRLNDFTYLLTFTLTWALCHLLLREKCMWQVLPKKKKNSQV